MTPTSLTCSLVQWPKPGLDVLAEVLLPLPSLLSRQSRGAWGSHCLLFHLPSQTACRQGQQGTARGDPRTPHQPELLVSQKGDVEALTQHCFSSALGGSLSCRGHLGCRGGSVPQSGTLWGCRLWGAVSFQTYAGPETNLPSNLLLTETKCSTESASGDPKPRLILEALLSPSLQPCGPAL